MLVGVHGYYLKRYSEFEPRPLQNLCGADLSPNLVATILFNAEPAVNAEERCLCALGGLGVENPFRTNAEMITSKQVGRSFLSKAPVTEKRVRFPSTVYHFDLCRPFF
ncbi:MAG TPA: hypothetical protein DEP46_06875 [Blastocatellia bacterium]|nr:hypothetical protein [Blastocatellia bacterium]